MLRVLLATFNPVNNLICCKTGVILVWLVKRPNARFSVPQRPDYRGALVINETKINVAIS